MQQQTIFQAELSTARQFDGTQIQQRVDVRTTIANAVKLVTNYFNQRSEFYSRLCDFSVTRRTVLYMHLGVICLGVSAFAVVSHPFVSVTAVACAGWLVYRLNTREGGEQQHS